MTDNQILTCPDFLHLFVCHGVHVCVCVCQCVSGQADSSFESRVVVVCEKMMNRACWAKSKHLIHSKTFRGMTLLHLAAGQGYATLIQTLIKWR